VIWDVVEKCLNSSNIPGDIKQCWRKLSVCAPQIQNMHTIVVSTLCWAI
jgi:hypothetical protein